MGQVQILGEFYFSKVMKKPILDATGKKIGRVMDMAVRWDDISPRVVGIKYAKNVQKLIPISCIQNWNEEGLTLKETFTTEQLIPLQQDETYVGKWILDKQIIDIKGSKLVRVNDIKLSIVYHEENKTVILVAVDIGVRGLFRRIGMEKLVSRFDHKFLGWQYITPLQNKMDNLKIDVDFEHERLSQLHPADIADIIEEMDHRDRTNLINRLDPHMVADALAEADLETQVEIIERLDHEKASDILEEMPSDEAADILSELSTEKSEALLNLMEPEEAREVRDLMEYPEDTAGALMTTEYLSFPATMTVEEVLTHLRQHKPEDELIYYLYILDKKGALIGVVSLRQLIMSSPETKLNEIMNTSIISINHMENHERVSDYFRKYGFLATPVVNDEGIMEGIITVDDILYIFIPDRSELETFSKLLALKRLGRD